MKKIITMAVMLLLCQEIAVPQVYLYNIQTKSVNNVIYSLVNDTTEAYLIDRSNPLYKEGDAAIERWLVINPPVNFAGKQIQGTTSRILTEAEAGAILDGSVLFIYKRPATANQLWEVNQRVGVGDKRIYKGMQYTCYQKHTTLQNWNPEITIGILWTKDKVGYAWDTGISYAVNDSVTYQSQSYRCLQAHVSQLAWNPVATIGVLWSQMVTTNAWAVGVAYKVNDEVTYQGSTYRCRQAHTSISTWTPPATPALWLKL